MARKSEFSLIKVEINHNIYSCSNESGVGVLAQTPVAPSRKGWWVWAKTMLKGLWFCGRVYLALHGGDPNPMELLSLGSAIVADVLLWIKDHFEM